MKLSKVVELSRELAPRFGYPKAVFKALRQSGCERPHVVTVRAARYENDIGANESLTLISAITSFIARQRVRRTPPQTTNIREKQLELSL